MFAQMARAESPQAIVGKRDSDFHWATEAERWRKNERTVVASGQPAEHQLHQSEQMLGKPSWLGINQLPITDEHGNVTAVLGLISDVTERRLRHQKVQHREEEARLILDAIPDSLTRIHRDGTIVPSYLSELSTMRGHHLHEGAGKNIDTTMPIASARLLMEKVAQTLTLNQITTFEYPLANNFFREVRLIPTGVDEVLMVERDITARKLAQLALERRDAILESVGFASRQLLRADTWQSCIGEVIARLGSAAEFSRVHIYENECDQAGVLRPVQTYAWLAPTASSADHALNIKANSAPIGAYGCAEPALVRGEAFGSLVSQLPHHEQQPLKAQNVQSILIVPIFVANKFWGCLGFDDCEYERIWDAIEVDAFKIAADNLAAAIEKAQAQTQLLQSQKLESVGLLAGGIAHDFNNLLTGMLAQSSLALAKLPASEQSRKHIEKAVISAERAAVLTRQLLAYAGKGQFSIAAIDINQLINENAMLLSTTLPSEVDIQLDLSATEANVEGDLGQLQQIIMNLVINAGDAMRCAGGTLLLRTVNAHLDLSMQREKYLGNESLPCGHYVVFEVADSGIGMAAETLDRIFDPYFTTKSTGQGLGLAAALGIIRSHGGGLQVESELNCGSNFKVYLPVLDERFSAETIPHTPLKQTATQ